ncbi:hypothetical protein [Paraburkholderia youngii]|uniref:hypothetical protein n=1 Tax=Paraburkholderia youngii TaxID=2782701 RepID=UPI003D1D1CA2
MDQNKAETASNQAASAQKKTAAGLSERLISGFFGALALLAAIAMLNSTSSTVFSILVGLVLVVIGGGGIYFAVAATIRFNRS